MSAPVPEVDPGLLEVLKSAPDHGGWRAGMDDDDYRDLARAVQGYVEGRVAAALEDAAVTVEASAWTDVDLTATRSEHVRRAAQIVRSDARRSPLTASTRNDGPEGVRGGDRA